MRQLLSLLLFSLPLILSAQLYDDCDDALENISCGVNFSTSGFSENFNQNVVAFTATDDELEVFLFWECDDLGDPNIGPFLDVYSVLYEEDCSFGNFVESSPGCDVGPVGESLYTYSNLIIGQVYILQIESCEAFPCEFETTIEMANSELQITEVTLENPVYSNGCGEGFMTEFCANNEIRFTTDPLIEIEGEQQWYINELSSDADAGTISWETVSGYSGNGNSINGIEDSETEILMIFESPGLYEVCFDEFITECQQYEGDCFEIEIVETYRFFEDEACIEELSEGWMPEESFDGYEWYGEPIFMEDLSSQSGFVSQEYDTECECFIYQEVEFDLYYPGEDGSCLAQDLQTCPDWSYRLGINGQTLPSQEGVIALAQDDVLSIDMSADNLPDQGTIDWYISTEDNFDTGADGVFLGSSSITGEALDCQEPEILSILYKGKESYVPDDSIYVESEMMIISSGSGFYLDDLDIFVNDNCDDTCPTDCVEINNNAACGWTGEIAHAFENIEGKGSGDYIPPNSVLIVYFGPDLPSLEWTSDLSSSLGYCMYVTTSECNRCLDAFSDDGGDVYYGVGTSECGESEFEYVASRFQGDGSYVTKEGWYGRTDDDKIPPYLMTPIEIKSEVGTALLSIPCDFSNQNAGAGNFYIRGFVRGEKYLYDCCSDVTPLITVQHSCNTDLAWASNSEDFLPRDMTITTSDCPYFLSDSEFTDPNTGETWTIDEVRYVTTCLANVPDKVYLETDFVTGLQYEEEYTYYIIVEGGCGGRLEHSFTITLVCEETTTSPDDQLITDYPWTAALIDYPNCNDMIHAEVYDFGSYSYVYIDYGDRAILYFGDGTVYCTDAPGFDCTDAYGLMTPDYEWDCEDDGGGSGGSGGPTPADDYPWMTDYVDFDDCLGVEILFYDFFGTVFPYFEANGNWTLFSNTGQVYCTDSPPGFICPDVYGLGAPLSSWECGQDCICPQVYDPVCGVDGVTYGNSCEADCAGIDVDYVGECNPLPSDPIFDEYPWLLDLVDPTDCDEDESLTVYQSGSYFYIFHVTAESAILYNAQGQFYCQDFPNFSCVSAYGFGPSDIVSVWNCDSSADSSHYRTTTTDASFNTTSVNSLVDKEEELKFVVYPNPSTGNFTIRIENGKKNSTIAILNMEGRQVFVKNNINKESYQMAIEDLPKGIYFVQLRNKEDFAVKRILVL